MFKRIKRLMEQQYNRRKADPSSPSWSRIPSNPTGQSTRSSPEEELNLELIKKTIKERKKEVAARKRAEKDRLNRREKQNRRGSL